MGVYKNLIEPFLMRLWSRFAVFEVTYAAVTGPPVTLTPPCVIDMEVYKYPFTDARGILDSVADAANLDCYINGKTNAPYFFTTNTDGTRPALTSALPIAEGAWQRVTFVFLATGRKIFVNHQLGVQDDKVSHPMKITQIGTVSNLTWHGRIRNVKLWNAAPTEQQMEGGYVEPASGLAAWWKLDGNAQDSSGNGVHWALSTGAYFSQE